MVPVVLTSPFVVVKKVRLVRSRLIFEQHILVMLSVSTLVSCSVKAVLIILINDTLCDTNVTQFSSGSSSNRGSSVVLIPGAIIISIGLVDGIDECLDLLEAGLMFLDGADLSAHSCRSHGLVSESIRVLVR